MRMQNEAQIRVAGAVLLIVVMAMGCTSGPSSPAFGGAGTPPRTGAATVTTGAAPTGAVGTAPAATAPAAIVPGITPPPSTVDNATPAGGATDTALTDPTVPRQPVETAGAPDAPGTQGGAAGGAVVTTTEEAQDPPIAELPETYRIQRGDVISIAVFREESLNREVRVDADGTVNLPLVKQVYVEGMTKYEAEQAIAGTYADGYLKNPLITVEIRPLGSTLAEGMVRILGEVRRPGLYPVPPGGTLSLLNALTSAGGLTEVAARGRIQITRVAEEGERQTFRANFDRIVDGTEKDFELVANDIVRVPTGWW